PRSRGVSAPRPGRSHRVRRGARREAPASEAPQRSTTSTTADRGQSEDAAAAASQTGRTREDGHADRQRATDTITNECGTHIHTASCPGRGRGRCCGRGVCHGQRLQQVPLPSEAGFPLHWQVQCAPGAPSPSGRTRPRLRYFSTEAASNRAAGSGRIVPPPPPP
ncbi:unnamed protein product, partial [Prorocentrum cordatum]